MSEEVSETEIEQLEDELWDGGTSTGFEMFDIGVQVIEWEPVVVKPKKDFNHEKFTEAKNEWARKTHAKRYAIQDDTPIPELLECPDWVQLFNRNSFSVEEQDWILFIDEVVPNSNDKEGWKKFNEDTDNRQYARELLEYLSDARSDTFIKILKYREWFKERVWYLALIYNKKVLKRIENPTFEDKIILYYFYE